jgi:mRNA-degrading endonuclease toxin of MazEF toxin-antitoxin module
MQRGDVVTVALRGDTGKPRPALVIRADRFATRLSLGLFRIHRSFHRRGVASPRRLGLASRLITSLETTDGREEPHVGGA